MDFRFEEYLKALKESVLQKTGSEFSCQVIRQPAGVKLAVQMAGRGSVQMVGVDAYYRDYIDVEVAACDIVGRLYTAAAGNRILEYDGIKDSLMIRLENGRTRPKGVLYRPYLDFAVTFHANVLCGQESEDVAISSECFRTWDMSVSDVYEQALCNERKYGDWCIIPAGDVLRSRAGETGTGQDTGELWLIVSNAERKYGANAMLVPEVLEKLSGMYQGKFIILPFSVHEIITIPYSDMPGSERFILQLTMKCMFEGNTERNAGLSDRIYYYDPDLREIRRFA